MGLGPGDDMLDVRLLDAVEPRSRIWAVDSALGIDDFGFNRRRIGIVVRVVGRAPVLGRHGDSVPGWF